MQVHFENALGTIALVETPVAQFTVPDIAGSAPKVACSPLERAPEWTRVRVTWELTERVTVSEAVVPFNLSMNPDFWWAPHLAPEEGFCIAQHVFRSPALIAQDGPTTLVLVPDLDICGQNEAAPWFMDLDAPNKRFAIGFSNTDVPLHVLYKKAPGMRLGPGKIELGFFVTAYKDTDSPRNPWGKVTELLWDRYARPLYAKGEPGTVPMDRYVDHTYRWALDSWRDAVWQEFEIDGKKVGGPAFIVNVTQSPNYKKPFRQREFLSLWNQAWFSTLRAGTGMYRYGRKTEDHALIERAKQTLEFTLAAPEKDGIFYTVYGAPNHQVTVDGVEVTRSLGWDHAKWTNSDRCPLNFGVTPDWFHILDNSWTSLLLLRWYEDVEKDERILRFVTRYADKLLTLQDADGFFPGWLHPETLEKASVMNQTPETSMSVTFLLKLAEITGEAKYKKAALKAMDALLVEVVPQGRWEDFETYWSCSGWGNETYVGKKIARNAMYKQCNLSTFWTAEALLETYRATKNDVYLRWGRRTLDELAMTQQVWQPPYIYIPALGGFGVMNVDGEWNDSRQCLFAPLFMEYYKETGDAQLFERGVAALKSAFVMMYCPENPSQKALWEKVWPFLGREDYGFMMENYGHGGRVSKEGEGVGEFTIFTWGNGAASEARANVYDRFGDVYIDLSRNQGFGIDSIAVTREGDHFILQDLTNTPRDIRVVYSDGAKKRLRLEKKAVL